jgi:hypothetical protein
MIELGQIRHQDLRITNLIVIAHMVVIMELHTQCGMDLNTFIGHLLAAEQLLTMIFKLEDHRLVAFKDNYYEY